MYHHLFTTIPLSQERRGEDLISVLGIGEDDFFFLECLARRYQLQGEATDVCYSHGELCICSKYWL